MGRPLVEIPKITQKDLRVNLCEAELLLYKAVTSLFIQNVNSEYQLREISPRPHLGTTCGSHFFSYMSMERDKKPFSKGYDSNIHWFLELSHRPSSQWKCILTMFLKLRMLVSHLLTSQDIVRYAIKHNSHLMNDIKALTTSNSSDASTQIVESLLVMADTESGRKVQIQARIQRLIPSLKLSRNRKILFEKFEKFLEQTLKCGNWLEHQRRLCCAHCEFQPQAGILTSCNHLYCEECFECLLSAEAGFNTGTLVCYKCTRLITGAAYYNMFERIDPDQGASSVSTTSTKRKRGTQATRRDSTAGSRKKRAKKYSKSSKASKPQYGMFLSSFHNDSESEVDGSPEEEDSIEDWIPEIGPKTPGAKLSETRELIRSFVQEDEKVKVVIFTIFIDTTTLLEQICQEEKWSYTKASYRIKPNTPCF